MISRQEINKEEICIELAKKYGLTKQQVIEIVSSQFRVLKEAIINDEDVMLQKLGKFTKNKIYYKNHPDYEKLFNK
jgi:nucleoid DNA-binding protein